MVRWSYTRPYALSKDSAGLFVGVTSSKRKIIGYYRNTEEAYEKIKVALRPDESLSYVYKDR